MTEEQESDFWYYFLVSALGVMATLVISCIVWAAI
jgi:hypothetical protein